MEKHIVGWGNMNMVPQIKICGITTVEEAEYLNKNNVDYAGFVIFEKSKRHVTVEQAREIFDKLNPDIKKVAVVVSPDSELVKKITAAGFDIIQIHGEMISDRHDAPKTVWRAVNIKNIIELKDLPPVHFLLYDALVVDAGDYGSGKTFGWNGNAFTECVEDDTGAVGSDIISDFRKRMEDLGKKFILAGGLKPDNVAEGISIFSPDIVDVSSGVEFDDSTCKMHDNNTVYTGRKDPQRIEKFVSHVRQNIC